MPKCHQPLKFSDLNSFLTKFCDNYQRHDYSSCLQWHSNMSPHFSNAEVKKKHLRRIPVQVINGTYTLLYENEKCVNPDTCPDKNRCRKCHNEKEFMYHPLVYMTAKCNNGPACKNRSRFCAFYHTDTERIEAERNRDDLLKKLNRSKEKRSVPSSPNMRPVQSKWGDIMSSQDIGKEISLSTSNSEESQNDQYGSYDSLDISNKSPRYDNIDKQHSNNISSTDNNDNSNNSNNSSNNSLRNSYSGISSNTSSTIKDINSSSNKPLSGYNTAHQNISYSKLNVKQVRINEKITLYPNKILSQRADGIIYEGIYNNYGIEYSVAIKEIDLRKLGDDILNYETLTSIEHRNLIKYYTVCYTEDRVYIVMELHKNTLSSFIKDNFSSFQTSDQELTPLAKSFLHQLCDIIVYLQIEKNITHCDLLADNIFIELHNDNNHRIILGDFNRSTVHQRTLDNFSGNKNKKNTYKYIIPSKEWASPEEISISLFTKEQMFQSDMWRLGVLIFYILSGELYSIENSPKLHANIFLNSQAWSSLSSMLLHRDYQLRLSSKSILNHPTFWYFLPVRVGKFYTQLFTDGNDIDIHSILSNVNTSTLLYPRSNWKDFIVTDNFQHFPNDNNGTSPIHLIQIIVNMVTHRDVNDEYYNAVIQQCNRLRITEPIVFFQKHFPCFIFKLWEILFQEKKYLEKQQLTFSDVLSC